MTLDKSDIKVSVPHKLMVNRTALPYRGVDGMNTVKMVKCSKTAWAAACWGKA